MKTFDLKMGENMGYVYFWTDDIEDAYKVLSLDEQLDILYEIARSSLIRDGANPDEPYFDDAVAEEAGDIIGFYRIRTDSILYQLLCDWYAQQGRDMKECIRGYYEDYYGDYIYYITGCGCDRHDILSADLLGGSADGEAHRQFEAFVREQSVSIA